MKKNITMLLILGLALTFAGCLSTTLQPSYVPLGRYDMLQVRSDTPVALVNAQEIGMTMVKVGKTDTETDLSLWSAGAVTTIGTWLKTYNVHLSSAAMKTIKVSIVDPSINLKKHLPCAELTLKIETDTDLEKLYPAQGCASTNNRAIGYAISYAVIDMIRDREITDYIEQKGAPDESQQ